MDLGVVGVSAQTVLAVAAQGRRLLPYPLEGLLIHGLDTHIQYRWVRLTYDLSDFEVIGVWRLDSGIVPLHVTVSLPLINIGKVTMVFRTQSQADLLAQSATTQIIGCPANTGVGLVVFHSILFK